MIRFETFHTQIHTTLFTTRLWFCPYFILGTQFACFFLGHDNWPVLVGIGIFKFWFPFPLGCKSPKHLMCQFHSELHLCSPSFLSPLRHKLMVPGLPHQQVCVNDTDVKQKEKQIFPPLQGFSGSVIC